MTKFKNMFEARNKGNFEKEVERIIKASSKRAGYLKELEIIDPQSGVVYAIQYKTKQAAKAVAKQLKKDYGSKVQVSTYDEIVDLYIKNKDLNYQA
jgi:predicted hydrocarbon binding protein